MTQEERESEAINSVAAACATLEFLWRDRGFIVRGALFGGLPQIAVALPLKMVPSFNPDDHAPWKIETMYCNRHSLCFGNMTFSAYLRDDKDLGELMRMWDAELKRRGAKPSS